MDFPPYRIRDDLRRHWTVVLLLAVVVVLWGWFDVRRRGRIDAIKPDVHRTDFTVYTAAGAAFFDGRDPYRVTNPRGWSYLYPPLFALAVSPLRMLDSETQTFVWLLISAGFAAGCYVEARRWLAALQAGAGTSLPAGPIPWPALLTALLPAANCLQRGQIGVLQLYFLMLGFRWIACTSSPWRWLAGGMLLAIPVVLKITPALPVGCLLLMLTVSAFLRSRPPAGTVPQAACPPVRAADGVAFGAKACGTDSASASSVHTDSFASSPFKAALASMGVAAGIGLWLFAAPAAVIGWDANLKHLGAFSDKVLQRASNVRNDDFGGEVDSPRNQSLDNALYRLGLVLTYKPDLDADGNRVVHVGRPRIGDLPRLPIANRIALAINALLAAGFVVQMIALARDGRVQSLATGFALASVLSLIVSPVSRGHYFVMLLPLVLLLPIQLQGLVSRRTLAVLTWTPVALTALQYAFVDSLGRLGLYGLSIAVWYVAVALFVAFAGKSSALFRSPATGLGGEFPFCEWQSSPGR